jgi:hypothetical protein
MKTTTLAASVAALLFSVPALAQHAGVAVQGQQQHDQHQAHSARPPAGNPDDSCDHDRQHPGYQHAQFAERRGGRYELRTTQRWVEGYYQSTWVPGACVGRHIVKVCSPGYYRQDYVAGHYVNDQSWVFIEDRGYHHRRGFGRAWGRR